MKKILRQIVIIFLCLIILIAGFYIVKNIDTIFCATIKFSDGVIVNECKHLNGNVRIKYQYPDGCIEKFLNTELITPECMLGIIHRAKEKEESSLEMPFTFNDSVWKIKE